MRARQRLETAVDAAALAGGLELPDSGSTATTKVLEYLDINDPGVNAGDVTTTFRCLVGDRNHDGQPDPIDIPAVCDPGTGNPWTCADGLCMSWCVFTGNNKCNVIAVEAQKDVPLIFTTLLGLPPVQITASRTGACNGPCGSSPTTPLDIVIILDRTSSMSASDLSDAKNGALAVLGLYDPEFQHVGLAVLGAGDPSNLCVEKTPQTGGNWLVVPLSSDYKNADGSLNMASNLVSTINCLQTSSQGTDLGSPLSDNFYNRPDALTELLNSGRNVKKGIILLTDGAANAPTTLPAPVNPCAYANDRATIVKNASIEIFTIGYGVAGQNCSDQNGTYATALATVLLADMATDSADDHGHCSNAANIEAENIDGDHFLCQAKGSDLEKVFATAAAALAPEIKLIAFPQP